VKRLFARLVVVLALLAVATPLVQAQYTVQPNDTLWGLAGKNLNSTAAWETIYAANPFLHEPGRRFERDGWTIVVLKPGEKLAGLNEVGIVPTKLMHAEEKPAPEKWVDPLYAKRGVSDWIWPVLFLIVLSGIFTYSRLRSSLQRERKLSQNPVTSGVPIYSEGVTDETVSEAFQYQASDQYTRETGRGAPNNLFTVLRSTPGHAWGIMNVGYADDRVEARRLNGERVYQGSVRFPDGKVETLYMLQGCGNDLRFGGVRRYEPRDNFRFEPDPPVVAAHTRPTAAEVAGFDRDSIPPATETAPGPDAPTVTEPVEDGIVRFEIRPATEGQPAMVRMTGVNEQGANTIELQPGVITLRYTPRQ